MGPELLLGDKIWGKLTPGLGLPVLKVKGELETSTGGLLVWWPLDGTFELTCGAKLSADTLVVHV